MTAGSVGLHCQLTSVMLMPQDPLAEIGWHWVGFGDGVAIPDG